MRRRISQAMFALTAYAVVIILWGAWVRISGSGEGCGSHWPLCNGSYLPENLFLKAQTAIEFLHRIKSGLFGVLIVAMVVVVLRSTQFSRLEKWVARGILFFTVSEALLGAALVIFGLVKDTVSSGRAVMVALHLVNTLFLLSFLTTFVVMSRESELVKNIRYKKIDLVLLGALIVAAAFGALASLSSTLFPASSLLQGLQQDLSNELPWFLSLRMFHPLLGLALLVISFRWINTIEDKNSFFAMTSIVITVIFGMFALGFIPRPTWMKLTHLFLADLTLIILIATITRSRIREVTNLSELSQ